MQPAKRRKLIFGFAIAAMLTLIAIGMVLTFAQGLDRRKIFLDLDAYWAVLPFSLAFPVYIAMEYFLSGKFQEEGYLLGQRCQNHERVVSVSFFVALVCLLGGGTLTFTMASSLSMPWVCFIESSITALPLMFYLIYSIIGSIKENASVDRFLYLGGYLGALLVLDLATLFLSLYVSLGFLLFYAALPLLCLVMVALASSPSPQSEASE